MAQLNVLSFTPPPLTPDWNHEEVIRVLEQSLEHARAGRCRSVAVILDCDDGTIMDAWHNGGKPYEMLGAIESLKIDFTMTCIERR
ncbi:hypothetical protein V8N76_004563 [Salmonella enterica]